jgi:hypothetical protein
VELLPIKTGTSPALAGKCANKYYTSAVKTTFATYAPGGFPAAKDDGVNNFFNQYLISFSQPYI